VHVVETTESTRRSRTTLIAVTAGVVVAAALLGYGFSRSDDDRVPSTDTSPIVGVIQAPANVATTHGPALPPGTPPATADVPTIPTGTADVAFPPVSVDIPSP
jgi:hypothetical protein